MNFREERSNRLNRYIAVVNAYNAGWNLKQIEEHFGCSRRTVYNYLKMAGVEPHLQEKKEHDAASLKKKIIEAYRKGMPVKDISKLYNLTGTAYVSKVANEAGLRRKRVKRNVKRPE